LCGAMADRGSYDIRLEAAIAKLYNSEGGWRIIDDTVQIRGGRGYETADSLRARGEKPVPVERIMRDFRINLIFEGSSEIMHLFIAREAVDKHLQVAGDVAMPGKPLGERLRGLVRAALFYGWWYPSRWLGWGFWPKYTGFGPLAKHLRYVERAARRLARGVFHAMMRFGPKLEYRQAVLFRLVDVGAELFAMAAACSRAQWLASPAPAAGRRAVELADLFCHQARARVNGKFRELWRNADTKAYRVAQETLAGEHRWLERGMVELDGGVAEPHPRHASGCSIMIDRSLSGVPPAMSPYGDGWPWASITIVGHTNSYRREVIRSAAALGGTGGGI